MEMLTPREIADILKISYHKALDFIKYSGIDYIKVGSRYRVSKEKFFAYVNSKGKKIV
ncbi:MAG: helix-turn-helix domain-containing protein [Ruminococcaceae bacterium]|nr:helix-turn-helix domain-containing protein [Oscillospiraceae bacterium]